jgi:hypothetical protein
MDDVWKNLENLYDENYFYDDRTLIKINTENSGGIYNVSNLKRKVNVKIKVALVQNNRPRSGVEE